MSCRLDGFDYTRPLYYMVTLKKRPGLPPFSRIVAPGRCRTNPVTHAMLNCIRGFNRQWPCAEPIECFTIMPDHVHLLLKIRSVEKGLSLPRLVCLLIRRLEAAVVGVGTPPRQTLTGPVPATSLAPGQARDGLGIGKDGRGLMGRIPLDGRIMRCGTGACQAPYPSGKNG